MGLEITHMVAPQPQQRVDRHTIFLNRGVQTRLLGLEKNRKLMDWSMKRSLYFDVVYWISTAQLRENEFN